LVSISPEDLALELVNQCLRGNSYSTELLETLLRMAMSADAQVARQASHALFATVVERLGDLFEPCLADCYASLFSEAIEYALPNFRKQDLIDRFRRVRAPRRFNGNMTWYKRVVVLSRVTLGADVAIVSLFLDAARQAFPEAELYLAGPAKNHELFARDPAIRHLPVPYPREGTLSQRLAAYPALRDALWRDDTLVLDPDSRLTQLGLLPVCDEENFYFFESRAYGEYSSDPLPLLANRWLKETFGVDAHAFLRPLRGDAPPADITVSLGVGENPSKRLSAAFERGLLQILQSTGRAILVDRGGNEEEAARVDAAVEGLSNVRTWTGPFAPFADLIARSTLYCGYDSAGQHVAAASRVPLVTIFTGFPSPRFLARWTPYGSGRRRVIVAEQLDTNSVLDQVQEAVAAVTS
jgi:ADP-heptose:LPS heptosyltransferase